MSGASLLADHSWDAPRGDRDRWTALRVGATVAQHPAAAGPDPPVPSAPPPYMSHQRLPALLRRPCPLHSVAVDGPLSEQPYDKRAMQRALSVRTDLCARPGCRGGAEGAGVSRARANHGGVVAGLGGADAARNGEVATDAGE